MGRRTPINVEVEIRNQDEVERMIKKFNRKVKKSGVLDQVRDRRYYEKPSIEKNRIKRKKRRVLELERLKRKKNK
jgi:small subunit ribosomal protein S21